MINFTINYSSRLTNFLKDIIIINNSFKECYIYGGKDRKGDFSMKKSLLLVLGLIALMVVSGLALASCRLNCPKNGCTVKNDGSGSTCNEGGCAAYKYMKDFGPNSPAVPPGCDC